METNFELDTNLDWLECSVASIELPTTKNKKHSTDKKWTWSAEVVEKMRIARVRQTYSDETRLKMSKSQSGKSHSENTKLKMSKSQSGRIHSDESNKKRREQALVRLNQVSNKLKKIRSEHNKKMSEAIRDGRLSIITPQGVFSTMKTAIQASGWSAATFRKLVKNNPTEYSIIIKECQE
jgi:TPP-dependent indolepyruvate ferredoxin oxidoreductase alpha subunit